MSTIEFNDLLLSNAEFLRPFAINLIRDQEQANDLFQDTMFRALSNSDKYNVGTNIKAWLYTIMRNIFINDYRKKTKQKMVSDRSGSDFLLDHNQSAVSNDAFQNLSLEEIKQAVHGLPDIFKIPFQLYVEGYKYQEITEMLNEPLGTIKSRIHFARKLLKTQIQRQ